MWTSNAHFSQWVFVICRTEPGSERHHGLSFLLVPLDQDGVEVRPIEQLTGGSEFNEVFFTGARTAADLVVGEPGDGWRVAMALLGFERGVSVLAQVVGFARELDGVVDAGQGERRDRRPVLRDRLAEPEGRARGDALPGAARALDRRRPAPPRSSSWSGPTGTSGSARWRWTSPAPPGSPRGPGRRTTSTSWQRLFLFSRADTIYGGSDEVQRNILAERVLGLPREPKGATK